MKLGATPQQLAVLAVIVAIGAYFALTGDEDPRQKAGNTGPKLVTATPQPTVPNVRPVAQKSKVVRPANGRNRSSQEFKPVVTPKRIEDRIDPATIDPTLKMELMARLENIQIQGGTRPLFEFGAAPPPKAPDPGKIIPGKVAAAKPVVVPPPAPVAPVKPSEPSKPQAPPIPLKFYGFSAARGGGAKRAFFLENEDVYVANEGEAVKKRYKIVRINLNSVVMEDLDFKQQQTLPLVEVSQ